MKHLFLLVLLLCYCPFISFGQNPLTAGSKKNNKIRGTVLFQNSARTVVEGVQIYGKGANPRQSDSKGKFTLEYNRKKAGAKAGLSIGATNANNQSIEWVNQREIEQARIPDHPKDSIFIIVCPSGSLASARQKYYNAIDHQLNRNYRKKMAQIEQLIAQVGDNKTRIIELNQQRDSIDQLYQKTLISLEETSDYLATLNKDFASDMVKAAIEQIEKEQDIDKALATLDQAQLEEAYLKALDKKLAAKEEIRQVIEGFKLRSKLLMSAFKYEESAAAYAKIIEIVEANPDDFSSFENAQYYLEGAEKFLYISRFKKSLDFCNKSLDILQQQAAPDTLILFELYDLKGNIYLGLIQIEEANDYLKKANSLLKHLEKESLYPVMAFSNHSVLGTTYKLLNQYSLAIQHKLEAFELIKDEMNPDFTFFEMMKLFHITITRSISNLYHLIGDFENSQKFSSLSVKYLDENDLKNPMANFYRMYHLGSVKEKEAKYEEAIDWYQQALDFSTNHLPKASISNLYVQNALGNLYMELNRWSEAKKHVLQIIIYSKDHFSTNNIFALRANYKLALIKLFGENKIDEAIQMLQEPLSTAHLDPSLLFDTYVSLILAYSLKQEVEKVAIYNKQLIALLDKPDEIVTIANTNNIGEFGKSLFLGIEFETAVEALKKIIKVMESRYLSNHPDIANVHLTIAGAYTNASNNYPLEKSLFHYRKAVRSYQQNPKGKEMKLLETYSGMAHEFAYADQIDSTKHYLVLAEEMYQKHLQNNKDKILISGFGFGNMAKAYNRSRSYKKALEWNQRTLAEFQYLTNNTDEKSPLFSKVISDEFLIRENLGITLLNRELYAEALPHFKRSVDIAPSDKEKGQSRVLLAECYLSVASQYFQEAQNDSALIYTQYLSETIEQVPESILEEEANLGFALKMGIFNYKNGAINASLTWVERCKRIIASIPKTSKRDLTIIQEYLNNLDYQISYDLGLEDFKAGNFPQAIAKFEQAIQLIQGQPIPSNVYEFLAFACNSNQQHKKAITYAEKLLKNYPEHYRPLFYYAYVESLAKTKKIKKAYALLPKVVTKPILASMGKKLEVIILTMDGRPQEALAIIETLYAAEETSWTKLKEDADLKALTELERFNELLKKVAAKEE